MFAEQRATASILNLTGSPLTTSLRSEISKFYVDTGVAQAMRIADVTYPGDAVDAMLRVIGSLSRRRRARQDIHKFCAKFTLGLALAERRLAAKLPAVPSPPDTLTRPGYLTRIGD